MPTSWPMVSLRDVLRPVSRPEQVDAHTTYRILGAHWYAAGLYTKDVKSGSLIQADKVYRVEQGDFVYNRLFAWKGSFAVATAENDGCYVSNEFPCFVVDEQQLDGQYLWRYFSLQSTWEQALGLSSGSTPTSRNRLKEDKLLAMEIPLPPLDEQRRIVARIDELAAKIGEAQELRRQAIEAAASLELASSNSVFDSARIAGWPVVRLGDVADIRSGVTLGRNLIGHTIRLPYLRVANVQDGHLDLSLMKEVEVLPGEAEKWLLQCGDVLLTEGGDWDKLGRGTVWQGEIANCIHQNHIFRVRVNSSEFDPHFVSVLIGSPYGKKYFQASAKQTTNLASINQRQLKAFELYKPPISEQQQIVTYLERVRSRITALRQVQEETAAELNAMLPSLLERAFSGLL